MSSIAFSIITGSVLVTVKLAYTPPALAMFKTAAAPVLMTLTKEAFATKLGDKAELPENKIVLDTLDSLKEYQNVDLENLVKIENGKIKKCSNF